MNPDNENYLSKYEGAVRGLECLPNEHLSLIQQALQVYASSDPIDGCERKTGGVTWDKTMLFSFQDYAREKGRDIWEF